MKLPTSIPHGARVVVRTKAGVSELDGRMKYSDVLGHVQQWDGRILHILRDPSRDGSRPPQELRIDAEEIVIIKPVPKRRDFPAHREPRS
jgi:hypothetical protein